MHFQLGHTKDEVVGGRGNVKTERLFIASCAEKEGVVVGDVPCLRGRPIS